MITIKDILNDEKFSKLSLINSSVDLNRKVSTIESTETPDITSYLTPNTFLLTTGMVYKDDQKGLCDLIIELNNLPCAALGIKLGRFIDKLDDEVIETANKLNFPLIQIPLDATLGNTFHKLLSHLWSNQNEQLLYSLNIQKKFSELMIRNAPLNVLIRNLSHTLKTAIALVDPFGNIINSCNTSKIKYPKQAFREIIEGFTKREFLPEQIEITFKDSTTNPSTASIYPINMAGYYPYYLIVSNAENMEHPLSTLAIEQALLILAFTLYKNLRISYSILTRKEDFFKDLTSSKDYQKLNESQLLFKGEKYRLKHSDYYQIIIATFSDNTRFINDRSIMEESYTLIYNWLNDKLSKNIEGSILFPNRSDYEYIILLQSPQSNLVDRLASYREVLSKTLQLDINFFMGNAVQDINSIQYSYKEALESMDFGETKDDISFIKYYNQLDTFDLLQLLPKNQLESFVSNTLKTLAYPEDEITQDLRYTLKTFLDLNCNITDTANALFIHRNTVKYRIDRCSEILGQDISDPNYSLKLRLSLAYTENDKHKR